MAVASLGEEITEVTGTPGAEVCTRPAFLPKTSVIVNLEANFLSVSATGSEKLRGEEDGRERGWEEDDR